jgi:hypothetical protein
MRVVTEDGLSSMAISLKMVTWLVKNVLLTLQKQKVRLAANMLNVHLQPEFKIVTLLEELMENQVRRK